MSFESWPRIEVKKENTGKQKEYQKVSVSLEQQRQQTAQQEAEFQEAEQALDTLPPSEKTSETEQAKEVARSVESDLKKWETVNVWGVKIQQKNGEVLINNQNGSVGNSETLKKSELIKKSMVLIMKLVLQLFSGLFWGEKFVNRMFGEEEEGKSDEWKEPESEALQERQIPKWEETDFDRWVESWRIFEWKRSGNVITFEFEWNEYSFERNKEGISQIPWLKVYPPALVIVEWVKYFMINSHVCNWSIVSEDIYDCADFVFSNQEKTNLLSVLNTKRRSPNLNRYTRNNFLKNKSIALIIIGIAVTTIEIKENNQKSVELYNKKFLETIKNDCHLLWLDKKNLLTPNNLNELNIQLSLLKNSLHNFLISDKYVA